MAKDETDLSESDRNESESSDLGRSSSAENLDGMSTSGFYDSYDAKEVLGQGLSSTVRRCIKRATGEEFAVKILDITTEKMSREQADELRRSTMTEIATLRQLAGHKNIIQLVDYFASNTFLFIVFELARGGELFDYLTEVVCVSEKKTRTIMKQLFEAVEFMHAKKIIHRDLKPENILMITDDTIKVTDFGFAVQLYPETPPLIELCGTPGYLAPEMLRASMYEDAAGYGLAIDLWACGVIMYSLLCGYAPFFHRKQIYMLRAIQEGKYEFRSPEWDEVGQSAKDLISKLLVVDPKKRFSATDALSHPFLQYGAGLGREAEEPKFKARWRFKMAILQVRSLVRLYRIRLIPQLIRLRAIRTNPYGIRKIRRQIDAVAFQMYGHWVKKGREQCKDALFANTLNRDEEERGKSVKF